MSSCPLFWTHSFGAVHVFNSIVFRSIASLSFSNPLVMQANIFISLPIVLPANTNIYISMQISLRVVVFCFLLLTSNTDCSVNSLSLLIWFTCHSINQAIYLILSLTCRPPPAIHSISPNPRLVFSHFHAGPS